MRLVDPGPIHCYCTTSKTFQGPRALEQHKRALPDAHHFCKREDRCDQPDFPTREKLVDHWVKCHSYCDHCKKFVRADGMRTHREVEHGDVHCRECNIMYPSPNSLKEHLRSSVHVERKKPCGCGSLFLSQSGIAIHLESGKCDNGMDKENLARFMADSENSDARPFVRTERLRRSESHRGGKFLTLQGLDGTRAWSRVYYVCPGCDSGVEYTSFKALSQHVDGAAGACEIRESKRLMRKLGRVMRGLKDWRAESDDESSCGSDSDSCVFVRCGTITIDA